MPKPSRIFIVRHGESTANVNHGVHETVPDWKIELTDRGREQARQAGHRLGELSMDGATEGVSTERLGVYVSPYRRTMDTWHEMSGPAHGHFDISFIRQDPRLREQEHGPYNDRSDEEVEAERDAYGSLFWRFPGGESGLDVWDRQSSLLNTLYRDFDKPDFPDNVLIVTHGYTLRVLLMRWLHWSVETFHTLANPPNASIFELRRGPDGRYALIGDFPVHAPTPESS